MQTFTLISNMNTHTPTPRQPTPSPPPPPAGEFNGFFGLQTGSAALSAADVTRCCLFSSFFFSSPFFFSVWCRRVGALGRGRTSAAAYSLARVTYNFYTCPRPRHSQYERLATPASGCLPPPSGPKNMPRLCANKFEGLTATLASVPCHYLQRTERLRGG